jgi:uracil-DNA glycosylase family protein
MPTVRQSWNAVRTEAAACTRCPLYRNATQTVFGDGPLDARIMLVGEQPGDQEDLAGHPFVGPAGRMLDKALEMAEVDRKRVYVTNAVKHFKNEPRGKRRLHKRPSAGEIDICKWWLDHELAIVKPRVVVALGATAARSLVGHPIGIEANRGSAMPFAGGSGLIITIHPSFLLRIPDTSDKAREFGRFVADLVTARKEATRRPHSDGDTRTTQRRHHPPL